MKETPKFSWGQRLPLVFGVLAISAVGAYITLFRSSPGHLSKAHEGIAGGAFIAECNKCHAGKVIAPNCLKCHKEIQAQVSSLKGFHGQLASEKKTDCAHCHSEHNGPDFPLVNQVSWEGRDLRTFKHAFTAFKLAGKHSSLSCEQCHQAKAPPFTLPDFRDHRRKQTFLGLSQDCISCHKDIHADGLAKDCVKCHRQDAWKPTPPLFDHERFFSLKLGHANLACAKCHVIPKQTPAGPLPKGFPFDKSRGTRCVDCHKSPHKARWRQDCAVCHTKSAVPWKEATARMPRALHANTGFRLIKPHQKASCRQCHEPRLAFGPRYSDPRTGKPRREGDCELCHRDPGRVSKPFLDPHGSQFAKHARCMDCHYVDKFSPPHYGVADHRKTAFPLTGRHAAAKCNACHVKDPKTGARRYTPLSRDCASCHFDVHYGQFQAGGKTRCDACHGSTVSWKKLVFDHNKQSRFPLDKAHRNVACKDCHPEVTLSNGKKIVQYKPLRMKCEDCHDFR